MQTPAKPKHIVSRQADEQALVRFLDAASGRPCALIIEGDPGIGKTTLWLDTLDRARDRGFRVLSSRAAAAESVLAYTALADLLKDIDEEFCAYLPDPQRQALDAALLRHHDGAPSTDARAVAAALLSVLGRLSAERPILVAIDDLQWLDMSSANALSFAARRLPVGAAFVCTTRTEEAASRLQLPQPDAVQRLRLQPLTIGELHQMLQLRLGVSVARPMLLRVHEISGGNPFFALELAREATTHRRTAELRLPGSLSDVVDSRIERIGPAALDALLAVASLSVPTIALVAQATDTAPGDVVEQLAEAENQSVVTIDGNRIQFTHPLLAHGVYSSAAPHRRRAMHRRLAELATEPELRARHLALSDATGEPQTIDAIDAAAEIARARGAPAAAAELLERALALGATDLSRRIRCATYYSDAGDPRPARELLEAAVAESPAGPVRARALHQLGLVRLSDDSFLEAAELFERAVHDSGGDDSLRVSILISLSYALLNAGRGEQAYERVQQALSDAERLGSAHLLSPALGMRAMMDFMLGIGFDEPALRRAVQLEDRGAPVPVAFRPHVQLILLQAWTGELQRSRDELATVGEQCLAAGEEGELIFVAFHLVLIDIWLGNLDSAAVTAGETIERAAQLGGDFPQFIALTLRAAVAAHAGRVDDARRDLREAIAAGKRCGSSRLAEWPATLAGFVELSCGNYQGAFSAIEPLLFMVEALPNAAEIISSSFIPDAVESLIALSRFDEAEPLIEVLERNGRRLDRAWALAVGMRCRAMLLAARGDVDAATTMAERAMIQHDRLPMPFERARTQLLLGQLQRRQRHRDAAAITLRQAGQTFEQLGTRLWAERVHTELAREVSGRRSGAGLTAAERRVADLAAAGLTNRDIAAALFISPKTVEVNLSRIYRKLNIRSRAEIHRALQSTDQPRAPKQ